METKDVIVDLRKKNNMTQSQLADKVFVTRQAISRWETGETVPNIEALKQLSKVLDVSINTLLGSPRKLICQCCGMEMDDSILSKEKDGLINEEYCQWCYKDGNFTYKDKEELIQFCQEHFSSPEWPKDKVKAYFAALLPTLDHWKEDNQ